MSLLSKCWIKIACRPIYARRSNDVKDETERGRAHRINLGPYLFERFGNAAGPHTLSPSRHHGEEGREGGPYRHSTRMGFYETGCQKKRGGRDPGANCLLSGGVCPAVGKFFGTKRGAVSLTDGVGKKYNYKIISWITEPATNEGSIRSSVPKKVFGPGDPTVTNKIGPFTRIEGFTVQ